MSTIVSQGTPYHATEFNGHLKSLLLSQPEYKSDSGELLLAKVRQHALGYNPTLIKLLLSDLKAKDKFFTNIEGTLIFNHLEFIQVLEMSEYLTSSYTKYTNKIGLTAGGTFLSRNDDVVLTFPYKDAVLVGGQDKEDQKRDEIFLHEVIGRDQITNLLAPKVLTNPIRYEGKQNDGSTWEVEQTAVTEVSDSDNLIIKGNNLVALATLREKYRGKVKCIFIDPPYNTGSDSYGYNDRFNHSSWLTFMKNRLEIAKDLLSEDGVLIVQCDDNEQAYLTVLMDEIFKSPENLASSSGVGRYSPNRINTICVNMSNLSGVKISSAIKGTKFPKVKEYILIYSKNFRAFNGFSIPKIKKEEWDNEYNLRMLHKKRLKILHMPLNISIFVCV